MRCLGVDIGRQRDPTALVAIEGRAIVDAHRFALGMPYPKQAKAIVETVKGVDALLIDATGVGRAVIDLVRADGVEAWAVIITGGKMVSIDRIDFEIHIPKQALIGLLSATLANGKLTLRGGDKALVKTELSAFECRQAASGRVRYEGVTEHDDIVIALALALLGTKLELLLCNGTNPPIFSPSRPSASTFGDLQSDALATSPI